MIFNGTVGEIDIVRTIYVYDWELRCYFEAEVIKTYNNEDWTYYIVRFIRPDFGNIEVAVIEDKYGFQFVQDDWQSPPVSSENIISSCWLYIGMNMLVYKSLSSYNQKAAAKTHVDLIKLCSCDPKQPLSLPPSIF
jgi:hypothetical protein